MRQDPFVPGTLVTSTDPGHKMVRELPAHGPWIYERVTKGGMAVIREPRTGERRTVAPSHLSKADVDTGALLDATYYGWQTNAEGDVGYRMPLPVTAEFPLVVRSVGKIQGATDHPFPPYIVADLRWGAVDVMLCRGDGWRAFRGDGDPHLADAWIYADGSGALVPEEWKAPIAAALAEMAAHPDWKGKPMTFRPRNPDHASP